MRASFIQLCLHGASSYMDERFKIFKDILYIPSQM